MSQKHQFKFSLYQSDHNHHQFPIEVCPTFAVPSLPNFSSFLDEFLVLLHFLAIPLTQHKLLQSIFFYGYSLLLRIWQEFEIIPVVQRTQPYNHHSRSHSCYHSKIYLRSRKSYVVAEQSMLTSN